MRTGAEQAEIEALFDVTDDPEVRRRLEAAELEVEDELVLRRVVQRSGRSRAFINGRLASAGQLAEIAQGLADISSQHEHHTLVNPHTHLTFLDAFAELEPLRARGARGVRDAAAGQGRARRGSATPRDQRGEREDLLRFQLQEIDALALEPGEEAELVVERDRQRHAERLAQVTGGAEDALYASDDAMCAQLGAHRQRARAGRGASTRQLAPLARAARERARAARRRGARARQLRARRLARSRTRCRSWKSGSTRSASSSASTAAASRPCSSTASAPAEQLAALDQSEERIEQLQSALTQRARSGGRASHASCRRRARRPRASSPTPSAASWLAVDGRRARRGRGRALDGGDDALSVDGARSVRARASTASSS